MSHQCPARGCEETVDDRLLMCRRHWFQVPPRLRSAVDRAYGNGEGLGTDALLHAQLAAIRAVNREAE